MRKVINGAMKIVEMLRDGELPFAAPNQHNAMYNMERLTGVCTAPLSHPMGMVDVEMSQNSGQARPPLRLPMMNDAKAANTSRGNSPTAV